MNEREVVEMYARWDLSGIIGNVRVSARCVTDEHKEKTLKIWRGMRAKNVVVIECPNAPSLPVWHVRAPSNRYHIDFEIEASSKTLVKQHLEKQLKLKPWQIIAASIEKVEGQQDTI